MLKQRIVEKYTRLYKDYRRYYPEQKDYTYKQLRQNIAKVASIVNATVDSQEVHNSTFIPWMDNGWKQLYFQHWYFAVEITLIDDIMAAIVMDAHYEGDHHNDTLFNMPYGADEMELQ